MRKIIILVLVGFIGSGCSLFKPRKITTQVIKVNTPVLYSPKPPLIDRPDLLIHDMTIDQKHNPGDIAKYYKATVLQLLGYVEQLETALDDYETISSTLDENAEVLDGTTVEIE